MNMLNYKGFGFFTILYLILSIIASKYVNKKIRIIRLPFFIRNRGKLNIGVRFTSGYSLRIDIHNNAILNIGNNVQVNDNCQIACGQLIKIGNNVLIASKVFITDHDHFFSHSEGASINDLICSNVVIEDCCWIGNNVTILKGVNIGRGSIVAAGSVVTKSFPENSIIAGVPARLI